MATTPPSTCHAGHVGSRLARAAAVATAAVGAYVLLLRRRQLRWGSSDDEVEASLPGDELIPHPDLVATRAIGIRSTPEQVWPWVAQMGQGRGGLYSYDWLENLVGCQMHSTDRVGDEWQDVTVGDQFRLHPEVALDVVEVTPPRALVVRGGVSAGGRPTGDDPSAPYDFTWAFVLVPHDATGTRLVVRERYADRSRSARPLVETVSVASFVMTERMLRGIRDRAEAQWAA